ncbi:MAG: ABC transporter permease [Xanthobacteraceae bacterium]|nr:ABC transporter permease [Xanthobacteraceae bacterium]QYK46149.1 MAG: ABC transporter permease [Xanthobacteraceae bacterium]
MLRYAGKRIILAVIVALAVSFAAFFLLSIATDPAAAIAGEGAEPEVIDHIREQLGLNRPLLVQYWSWLSAIFHGDLGTSYYWRQPVGALILEHLPVTLALALSATFVTLIVAIPLGTIAALYPNSLIDRVALAVAVSAQATPTFWLALILIIVFGVMLPIFPISGDTTALSFVLPAIVLGAHSVPALMRLTRVGVLDVMASDYIRTARAKGFYGYRLLSRQVMRNALLPVVSVLAVQLGHKLGGSVITETVFAMNGLGRFALHSIIGGDIPTVQMLVVLFAMTFIGLTLLADLLNAWLDPRLRLT